MKFFIYFYFITLPIYIFAQKSESLIFTYGEEILALADDQEYLWLGTDGGLVRFNKNTEKKVFYNTANTNSGLLDNHIRTLAVDSKRNLWIGTDYGGVSKFDGKNWQNFIPENSPLPWETVSCISIDNNDNIYIGSGDYLCIYDGQNWQLFELGNPLMSFFTFWDIEFDSDDNAWIAAYQGLFVLKDGNLMKIENDTTRSITSLAIDKNKNIWFGTSEYGLVKCENGNYITFDTTNSNIPGNNVSIKYIDDEQNIWCTAKSSLWKYSNGRWIEFRPDIPLPNNEYLPFDIILDKLGIIWIVTYGQGLLNFDGQQWKRYRTSNSGLINNFLNLLATDEDGTVWITFWPPRDSVLHFDGKEWIFYKKEDVDFWNSYFEQFYFEDSTQIWRGKGILIEFAQDDYIWAGVYNINNHRHGTHIKVDNKGNVWQVSRKGLYKYDGFVWTLYNKENTPVAFNSTGSIAFDDQWNLFANSDKGIIKHDSQNWILYPKERILSDTTFHYISSLEIDISGNIWLGTANKYVSDINFGEGLKKITGTTVTKFNYQNSGMPHAEILDLHFDGSGNLWIGTMGAGLVKFDCKDNWKAYDIDNSGIFSRFDLAPLEIDINENIWFGMWWGGLGVFKEDGLDLPDSLLEFPDPYVLHFCLFPNYPNPFNEKTIISYQLSEKSLVDLTVYNILGQKVLTIFNGYQMPDFYKKTWDGLDSSGKKCSSGSYFCVLMANDKIISRKMLYIK